MLQRSKCSGLEHIKEYSGVGFYLNFFFKLQSGLVEWNVGGYLWRKTTSGNEATLTVDEFLSQWPSIGFKK